jgi:hypothetical protein
MSSTANGKGAHDLGLQCVVILDEQQQRVCGRRGGVEASFPTSFPAAPEKTSRPPSRRRPVHHYYCS